MARYPLQPNQTPVRRAWLETLYKGHAKRTKGPTGFQCMRLGWTEWVDIKNNDFRECLTLEGFDILEQWRKADESKI